MKKLFLFTIVLSLITSQALAYFWTSAVPREIHITPHGLVIIGEFDQAGISCATGPKAVFLPKLDPLFKEKLSLALTAKATDKKIRTVIEEPRHLSCTSILATGNVPIASHNFWQLVD